MGEEEKEARLREKLMQEAQQKKFERMDIQFQEMKDWVEKLFGDLKKELTSGSRAQPHHSYTQPRRNLRFSHDDEDEENSQKQCTNKKI